jgi:hypothetical protein
MGDIGSISYMKLSIQKIFIKGVCVWLILGAWKLISTDWVIDIPKLSGGSLKYYPKNSPAWIPPKPKTGYSSFEKQITLEFGSGSGPFLNAEEIRISWNWNLILLKIFAPLIMFLIFFSIQEKHRLEQRRGLQSPKIC